MRKVQMGGWGATVPAKGRLALRHFAPATRLQFLSVSDASCGSMMEGSGSLGDDALSQSPLPSPLFALLTQAASAGGATAWQRGGLCQNLEDPIDEGQAAIESLGGRHSRGYLNPSSR